MNSLPLKHLFTTGGVILFLATGLPAAASPATAPIMTAPAAIPTAAAAAPQAPAAPKPTIKGKTQVGQTLKAAPGTWPQGTALTYQWYGNGRLLPGETGSSLYAYWPHLAMVISVEVTGTTPDGKSVTRTATTPTAVVQNLVLKKTAKQRRQHLKKTMYMPDDALSSAAAWLKQGYYSDVPLNLALFAGDLATLYNFGKPPRLGTKAQTAFLENCLDTAALANKTADQVRAGKYAVAKKNMKTLVKRYKKQIIPAVNKGYGLNHEYG